MKKYKITKDKISVLLIAASLTQMHLVPFRLAVLIFVCQTVIGGTMSF